jgi:Na+/melibiose symporter-like transporter
VKNRYLQIYEFLETQKLPYFKLLKITFKQKNYMIFLVAFTLFQTAQTLNRASELFMLKEVLKVDLSIMVVVGIVLMITIIPSIFVWSYIAKKIGHANVWTICLFLFAIGYFIWMFLTSATHYVLIVVYMGITTGSYISIIFSVLADTNDEVVDAAGRHVEASLMGIRTFFLRVAYLLTGVIIAGVHIATGYVPGASTQTELALIGIRIHTAGFPALFCLIAGVLMAKFYDLKGEKKDQLAASLRKKGL